MMTRPPQPEEAPSSQRGTVVALRPAGPGVSLVAVECPHCGRLHAAVHRLGGDPDRPWPCSRPPFWRLYVLDWYATTPPPAGKRDWAEVAS